MPWRPLIYEPGNGSEDAGDLERGSDGVGRALLTVFINDLEDDVKDIMTKSAGDIILGGSDTGQQ